MHFIFYCFLKFHLISDWCLRTSTRSRSRTTPAIIQQSLRFKRSTAAAKQPFHTLSSSFWILRKSRNVLFKIVTQLTHTGGRFTQGVRTATSTMTSSEKWNLLKRMSSKSIYYLREEKTLCFMLKIFVIIKNLSHG